MRELDARVVGGKLPVDSLLPCVAFLFPCLRFVAQRVHVRYSSAQALTTQGTEFYLGDVEPTAVLGRMVNLEAFCKTPSVLGLKCFIKRSYFMGVQIVTHKSHQTGLRVMYLKQFPEFMRPVQSGFAFTDIHVAPGTERFNKHKDSCGS